MRLTVLPGRKMFKSIWREAVRRVIEDERGVTAIEYTLIAALIAVAAVIVIAEIGADVRAPFNTIAGNL